MISEIEYDQDRELIKNLKSSGIIRHIIIIWAILIILLFVIQFSIIFLVIYSVLSIIIGLTLHVIFSQSTNSFNSFAFLIELDANSFDEKTEQYLSIIEKTENYLKKNKFDYKISYDGFKFGGFFLPYSKIFTIESNNLILRIRREKIGRFSSFAKILIGPVDEGNNIKLRQIIEKIRMTFTNNMI